MGYVYITKEQRKEIILGDDDEDPEIVEDELTEEQRREIKRSKSERKIRYFTNPINGK